MINKGILSFLIFFVFWQFNVCLGEEKQDSNGSFWNKIGNEISKTWHADGLDLYIPINTWHNRAMYDKKRTDTYNERPWGIGFGKTRVSENGNFHQLYIMEFQDSHDKVEPIFGYNFYKNWYFGKNEGFRVGVGFTASITMRHEYHYIPVPLPLPLFSIGYKWFAIENTYIPGLYNGGNVLFTWARISFKI